MLVFDTPITEFLIADVTKLASDLQWNFDEDLDIKGESDGVEVPDPKVL
jgi:hypothetical protein